LEEDDRGAEEVDELAIIIGAIGGTVSKDSSSSTLNSPLLRRFLTSLISSIDGCVLGDYLIAGKDGFTGRRNGIDHNGRNWYRAKGWMRKE